MYLFREDKIIFFRDRTTERGGGLNPLDHKEDTKGKKWRKKMGKLRMGSVAVNFVTTLCDKPVSRNDHMYVY